MSLPTAMFDSLTADVREGIARIVAERDRYKAAFEELQEKIERLTADLARVCIANKEVADLNCDLSAERDRLGAALDAVQAKLAEYLERLLQGRTVPNRWVGEINDIVVAAKDELMGDVVDAQFKDAMHGLTERDGRPT